MTPERAYLDYAATTPVDPRVVEAMLPYFADRFGNPSSVHAFGQSAESALEDARQRLAGLVGARPEELIFTSGGSESDNLAIRGVALAEAERRGARRLLISAIEHPAVASAAAFLSRQHAFEVELLSVDEFGQVDPGEVAARIRPDTALVSVMLASNEIGTINRLESIGRVCRQAGIPLHTDAVQAAAHLPLATAGAPADLVSLGAHKFYGPKGVGALVCRTGIGLLPLQAGGEQESGRRAGTQNVPLIVGMARALELTEEERVVHAGRVAALRDLILARVPEAIPGARLTGHPRDRLPNHASFVFPGIDGNRLLAALDLGGFACSSGSACKTGDPEPSSVLLALGLEPDLALSSLRVTLGRPTTATEVERFLDFLPRAVASLRQTAPLPG